MTLRFCHRHKKDRTTPVILCAVQRVFSDALQTQDLGHKFYAAGRIPDQRRSNEELPRRIQDDGWLWVGVRSLMQTRTRGRRAPF